MPTLDVRRADDRFHTKLPWLDSRHSFSFSRHYDPRNVGHGLLLVNNDDIVRAGTGFSTHPHQDMEIVTWVLAGELEHKDSVGNTGVIYPGLAQRMSAGTGIWHSEMNPAKGEDVHFVQMWVRPDTERLDPVYEQLDINAELDRGGLVPIASGRGHDAAIAIRQRGAVLWGGRLRPGETVIVPDARHAHVFVAAGRVVIEGPHPVELTAGDAVRLTEAGAPRIIVDPPGVGDAPGGAEVLICEMGGTA